MRVKLRPITVEANRWFKNGDHPNDNCKRIIPDKGESFNSEGKVVRYYRVPNDGDITHCYDCGNNMHEHGWIDAADGGYIVCPGDWIITNEANNYSVCKSDVFDKLYTRAYIKHVFVICSVRGVTDEYKKKLEDYVSNLESYGDVVHLPHRNTNQNTTGLNICVQNREAIKHANEVHIYYNSKSQSTHFDMGLAFALNKNILIIENEAYDTNKSFSRMLYEWEKDSEVVKVLDKLNI